MRRAVLLFGLVACGRVEFTARDDASSPDACTWGRFSTPVRLAGPINTAEDDWAPTPTRGELELFWFSYATPSQGLSDLWHATRPDRMSAFSSPSQVIELDTVDGEGAPTLTADGLDLVFVRSVGGGNSHLFETTRPSPANQFAPATLVPNINSAVDAEDSPFLSADGLRLVFASSRAGATRMDLYETTRPSLAAPFAPPVELVEVSSTQDDYAPTLSADGLDIFFTSLRPGGPGMADTYTAHRPALDQPFSTPVVVPELSSARDDVGQRLSLDGATMYIDYDALTGGGANADLWTATRSCN